MRVGSQTGIQTRVVLLALTWIKMSRGRFNSEMTSGPFSYAWRNVGAERWLGKRSRDRRRLESGHEQHLSIQAMGTQDIEHARGRGFGCKLHYLMSFEKLWLR